MLAPSACFTWFPLTFGDPVWPYRFGHPPSPFQPAYVVRLVGLGVFQLPLSVASARLAPVNLGLHLEDVRTGFRPSLRFTLSPLHDIGFVLCCSPAHRIEAWTPPSVSFHVLLATSLRESGVPGITTPGTFRSWTFSILQRFAPPDN